MSMGYETGDCQGGDKTVRQGQYPATNWARPTEHEYLGVGCIIQQCSFHT